MDFETPESLLEFSWEQLSLGVKKSKHEFHTLCVSSICDNGLPTNRTVVLRQADQTNGSLIIHSDRRSKKNTELTNNNNAALLFYSKQLKLQIRFLAKATVISNSKKSKHSFYASSLSAQRCYGYKHGPGTRTSQQTKEIIQPELNGSLSQSQLEFAYSNFSIIEFNIYSADILYLKNTGHTRINAEYKDGLWNSFFVIA